MNFKDPSAKLYKYLLTTNKNTQKSKNNKKIAKTSGLAHGKQAFRPAPSRGFVLGKQAFQPAPSRGLVLGNKVLQNLNKFVVLVGMHARASADPQCFVLGCSVEHPYILRFCNTPSLCCRKKKLRGASPRAAIMHFKFSILNFQFLSTPPWRCGRRRSVLPARDPPGGRSSGLSRWPARGRPGR